MQTLANIGRRSSSLSFVNPSRLYFVTKNQFLLQRLTEFVSYRYNFYTGDLVIYLDRANIIQGMKRLQAYRYELMPNGDQLRDMRRFSGSCRFVYNKALALQKENHEAGNKFIGYVAMAAKLPVWKREAETAWLKETPSQALQHALKDLEKAFKGFFAKRTGFPRFKKKGSGDSFRYPEPKQIQLDQSNNRILLPKLGWLRYRNSREALGQVRNVTVSQSGGKWFIAIQTQRELEQPLPTPQRQLVSMSESPVSRR